MLQIVDLLSQELLNLALIFARIGSAVMVLPVFGERYVMAQSRLWLALAVSVVMTAGLGITAAVPDEPVELAKVLIIEIILGLFIGASARLVLAVTHLAGGIIAMQSGLASAAFFDPTEGTQSSGIGNFLTILVLVLLVVADGHHLMMMGLEHSYRTLPQGALPSFEMGELFARLSTLMFSVSLQIAAPILVVGILVNIVSGVMNKLMPTFQVMFVILPLQIAVAFGVLMLALFISAQLAIDFFLEAIVWLEAQ